MLPVVIRGKVLEPGDPVFLRNDGEQNFRVANVEDGDEEQLFASFPVPRTQRRAIAVCLKPDEVLLAQEIQDKPITSDRLEGDLLIKRIAPDYVVVMQVQENVSGFEETTARRIYLDSSGSWVPVGDVETIPNGEAFPPLLFARIFRWRFEQIVDPLFDILAMEIGEAWTFDGAAILNVSDVSIPVLAKIKLEDDQRSIAVDANFAIAGLIGNLDPQFICDERLYQEGGAWVAHIAINGASLNFNAETGYRASIDVIPGIFEFTHGDGSIVATREVYVGAPIGAWSDPLYMREPPVPALGPRFVHVPGSIRCELFGRPAIIYQPRLHADSSSDGYRAVVYLGEPLSEAQHTVLSALLGYITGGRARNVLTETFAIDRKIKTIFNDRGLPTQRRCAPIPIERPTPHAALITAHLPTLLGAFTRWHATDARTFAAIFHHYAEGVDSSYPVTRILRLAVALEAFVNLVTQDTDENENIADHSAFVPLRNHLLATLREHANSRRGVFPAEVEGRYETKIGNMNVASNTQRIRRFWELVPIHRASDDDEFLKKLRNHSVHRGFVGDDMTPEGLRQNLLQANRLSDLFNRCVLTYAGYTGPMLSAQGRWIEPVSGQPFLTPEIPRGETIEVRTEGAPTLDAAEAAAAESLRHMQRSAPVTQ